jgi:membrane protein YdbS with pleckstrin-like domain
MIKDMFDPGEKLIWEGTPNKSTYVAGPIFLYIIAVPFFLLALINLAIVISVPSYDEPPLASAFLMVLFLIASLTMGAALPLYRLINWKHIKYAITDRHIYITSGFLGKSISVKDFTDIKNPEVSVGFMDKIKNCGSVHLTKQYYVTRTGRKQYDVLSPTLRHIPDPYGVFDLIKQMSTDINSDIHYPNALRAEGNAGFNTDYQPK